jgi:hypothetical protein
MGNPHEAVSRIVYCPQTHDEDPIYGRATQTTWKFLEQASPGASLDFSYRGVLQLRRQAPPGADVDPTFTPVLLGAHVERWAQTSPLPAVDQPVVPFLHGFQRGGAPQVYVAWRAFPHDLEPEDWAGWLDLAPVSDWETVAVPLAEARAFLAGTPSESIDADIESAASEQAGAEGPVERPRSPALSSTPGPTNRLPRFSPPIHSSRTPPSSSIASRAGTTAGDGPAAAATPRRPPARPRCRRPRALPPPARARQIIAEADATAAAHLSEAAEATRQELENLNRYTREVLLRLERLLTQLLSSVRENLEQLDREQA